MHFLYDNLIDNAYVTLTGSSAAAGFPASNLRNPHRTKCWQTAGAVAGTAQLVIDMSSLWAATTGSDLITNGNFNTNTNDWTPTDCTIASVAGGVSGTNCLEITRTGEAEQTAGQSISGLTVGAMYKLTAYVKSGTSGNEDYALYAIWGGSSSISKIGTSSGSWVLATLYFTAQASTITVGVLKGSATAGTMLFDSVQLYEMQDTNGYTDMGIEGIALTGYDWGVAPGTLQIEFANEDVWTSPEDTETLTWVSFLTPGYNKGTIIKKLSAAHRYRYARLSVVNADGDWSLGRLFLGPVFTPEREYSWGYGEEVVDPSLIAQSIGGQDHADIIESFRRVTCNGIILTQAQWALFQKMINSVGSNKPLFAAFDYANEAVERTIYGRFTKVPGIVRPYLYEYDFEFTEAR